MESKLVIMTIPVGGEIGEVRMIVSRPLRFSYSWLSESYRKFILSISTLHSTQEVLTPLSMERPCVYYLLLDVRAPQPTYTCAY